jgi:two-component system chemotaxis response regulator CheY
MPLRILIVDDSPATRFILRDVFEHNGHQVVDETETLDATVKAFTTHKPDVVTLDLSLTDCDGLTVLKELKKIDAKARVLVISGNAQKKVLEQVYASGAAGFLPKPFEPPDLLAAVAKATL